MSKYKCIDCGLIFSSDRWWDDPQCPRCGSKDANKFPPIHKNDNLNANQNANHD